MEVSPRSVGDLNEINHRKLLCEAGEKMCEEKVTKFVHRARNGSLYSSAPRKLCFAVFSLRGRLNPATSSGLHIRPRKAERKETFNKTVNEAKAFT